MKRSILFTAAVLYAALSYSQSGIDTQDPKATFEVAASPADPTKIDGVIAPRVTGDQLKAKDNLYNADQTGTFVYVTVAPDPVTTKTQNVTAPGYYYFDGTVWMSFKSVNTTNNDATRFLGGSIYPRYNTISTGNPQISDARVIGGGNGMAYSVGSTNVTSNKGGVVYLKGEGYTISNPSNGVFDIHFDTPMTTIYGVSTNILSAYSASGQGAYPNPDEPGVTLLTTDNTQVRYISNSIIRVVTGDQFGVFSNRPFTFLVTGK